MDVCKNCGWTIAYYNEFPSNEWVHVTSDLVPCIPYTVAEPTYWRYPDEK